MKERIVIEIPESMCKDCGACDMPTSKKIECYLKEERQVYEVEQVPETWEDLKELCRKSVATVAIGNGKEEGKEVEYIDVGLFILCSNKKIYLEDLRKGIIVFAQDQEAPQMWEKIKGWIGEER